MDDISANDVVFKSANMRLVAGLADVGGVLLVRSDGWLRREGNGGGEKDGDGRLYCCRGSGVDTGEGGGIQF